MQNNLYIPEKVKGSSTLALLEKVRNMKKAGESVISFAAGESDFDPPIEVSRALFESLKSGNHRYVSSQGQMPLRQALADDYLNRLGVKWAKPENILVTAGAKQAIHLILSTLLSPGDSVLVPAPYWVSYPGIIKAMGAEPVVFQTQIEDKFFPTVNDLEKNYRPQTKALLFASPGNPTGFSITKKQLVEVCKWARAKKVFVLFDELYERILLDEETIHTCPLSLSDKEEMSHVLSINAFSKSMSMTGWRLGYICTHEKNIESLTSMQSQVLTCMPGFIQDAALEALKQSDLFVAKTVKSYSKRQELFLEGVSKIPLIKAFKPEAGFYVIVDVRELLNKKSLTSDRELCEQLLDNYKLVVNPGSAFGLPGFLRFSIATKEFEILEGLKRLSAFVNA